jgi:hypothetical protein
LDVAMGEIKVGGRVDFAHILAGYDDDLDPVNADAQIGAVTVGGDWVASNLIAGASNAGALAKFGDGSDVKIAGGNDSGQTFSKIASIKIGGFVFGTPATANSGDHFGFVAESIGSFKAGGFNYALNPALHADDFNVGGNADVGVFEI